MFWIDGIRIDGDSALFNLRDRGLTLGDGVFDTSLCLNEAVAFAGRHMDRLANSCGTFGIPLDRDAVEAMLAEAAAELGTGALRITVTRGPAARGLLPPADPTPCIIVAGYPGVPSAVWQLSRLATTQIRRNETSPTSRHKCLNYLDAIVALKSAFKKGADEVCFQNSQGRVACCATGNLFVLVGNVLKTPPLSDGALRGVLRQTLLELADAATLSIAESSLTTDDLVEADAAFITNSLRLISPIVTLDSTPLATRGLGSVVKLARILSEHIQQTHGPIPWIEEGFAKWPIPA